MCKDSVELEQERGFLFFRKEVLPGDSVSKFRCIRFRQVVLK
jgi:hypothetical protein